MRRISATTFLAGDGAAPPAEAAAPAPDGLPLAVALRLLRTPSSEAGVQAYHHVLEGEPPAAATLVAELEALREGRATRFELLAEIATSPKARAHGAGGAGLWLIRLARKAFVASGAAARIRARRAQAPAPPPTAEPDPPPSTPDALVRRMVTVEGMLMRLEACLFAQSRAQAASPALAALEGRVAALEAELRRRIEAEATDAGRTRKI